MQDLNELINTMTPEIHAALKRAVELGKWPDGRPVSDEQRALCLEAVIHYEHQHLPPEQRTGYMGDAQCASGENDDSEPIKWQ